MIRASTSQEVWISLAKHFNRVSSSRMFELQRRLQTISKKGKMMSDYLREIKGLCDQLSSIGSPVSEKMKVFAALQGLGRDYEPIKTSVEGSIDNLPPPTYEDVVPRLTSYDDRLQDYSVGSDIIPHLAFTPPEQHKVLPTTIIEVVVSLTEDLVLTEAGDLSPPEEEIFTSKSHPIKAPLLLPLMEIIVHCVKYVVN